LLLVLACNQFVVDAALTASAQELTGKPITSIIAKQQEKVDRWVNVYFMRGSNGSVSPRRK
jgi:hypothetical protein